MATFKSAIRKLSRAFSAKDERAFDEALEELEEKAEEAQDGEEDPIEIHNHIPDARDTTGELPSREFSTSSPAFDEEPEWFKKHKEANDAMLKSMKDSFEEFMKKGKGEDRRDEEEEYEPRERGEEGEAFDDMGNLEMEDRRRSNDEPSEREEMAERIKERGGDRRTRNDDEANKEILGELEFEAPPGTGDAARRAKDSKYLEEAFQDAVAKAEVLAPGIRLPTFDRTASPARTMRQIVGLRRSALDLAYNTIPAARGVIDQAMSGRTMDSKRMKLGQARVLFNSVAGQIASGNNSRATDGATNFGSRHAQVPQIQTIADINKKNREVYARK
jgi:uncharacterized protein